MAIFTRHNLTVLLLLVALALSISSLAISSAYSLPLPPSFAVTTIVFTLAAAGLNFLARKAKSLTSRTSSIVTLLIYLSNIAFIVSASLSGHYVSSSELRHCSAELRWKNWFQNKNEAIRSIQNLLQCCGFNSQKDRAYPFPSKEHDALTCQRNSNVNSSCGILWENQLQVAALMCMIGSIIAYIASNLQDVNFPAFPDTLTRSPARISAAERSRLLHDAEASTQDQREDRVHNNESRSSQAVN